MNQEKIGSFISEQRKAKGMTQRELADALGISDKAISKWETGKSLPDVSMMLSLCEKLDISINELLSAEMLEAEDYHRKAEENIMNLMEETEKTKKERGHEGRNTIFGVVGVVLMFLFTVTVSMGLGKSLVNFIDTPSLIIVLIVDIFFLIATNGFVDFGRAFRIAFSKNYPATAKEMQRSIYAVTLIAVSSILTGWMGFLIGFITIMAHITSPESLGPNLAVAVLTNVYASFIALILLPIRIRVRQRLLDVEDVH